MDERTKRLVRLLQVVAHDIRNPLGVAQLKAEVMKRKPPTEEKLRADLDVITRNTAQIARMVDEIVDVAAMESGGIELEKAEHDVESLLSSARHDRVDLDVSPGKVSVDRERIEQVLEALLAASLTHSQGRVSVKATLTDTELHVVFEDDRTSTVDPATYFAQWFHGKAKGFSLTIAQGIIDSHGGKLSIEPLTPGARTTFTLPR